MKNLISATAIIFLSVAILVNLPYGFYSLLRLVVCGAGVYLAWLAYEQKKRVWLIIFALTALLFNPVFKIHFERELWRGLDSIAIIPFAVSFWTIKKEEKR